MACVRRAVGQARGCNGRISTLPEAISDFLSVVVAKDTERSHRLVPVIGSVIHDLDTIKVTLDRLHATLDQENFRK